MHKQTKKQNFHIKTTSMNQEFETLSMAVSEIRSLRRQNEIMAAKLQVFDSMIMLLHTPPNYPSKGMSPDITYDIEKILDNKKQESEARANRPSEESKRDV